MRRPPREQSEVKNIASTDTHLLVVRGEQEHIQKHSDLRCGAGINIKRRLWLRFHLWPAELREQLDRAMRLEEERRRAEQETARLEAERMEAIMAKEELERQAEHQIRSQEQLVSAGVSHRKQQNTACFSLPHFLINGVV